MKIGLFLITLLSYCSCPVLLWAQNENNVWCFGHRTGLDFNGSNPAFFEHNMVVREGCSSVSDDAGNLLFYTSGAIVWDRSGNLMPNGTALAGTTRSGMNSVAIVPSVSNPDQYYILATDEIESGLANAYYSVVDMSLNGGLGDVIPAQSSVLIANNIAEGVVVTSIPDCDGYWALFHHKFNNNFLAYKIDATGFVNSPVVSAGINFTGTFDFRYLSFNNKGDRMVRLRGDEIETAAFNRITGVLSDFALIDIDSSQALHCTFSPDDHKLYISSQRFTAPTAVLYQIDLSLLPNITAVENSLNIIAPIPCTGMRMGPDNKIYIISSKGGADYLACVNNPNASGAACNLDSVFMTFPTYSYSAVTLPFLALPFLELGNPVPIARLDKQIRTKDTTFCFADKATLDAVPGYSLYEWNTGSTNPSETVQEDGTYWVKSRLGCTLRIDSFRVRFNRFPVDLGPDTFLCEGQARTLDVTTAGATYLWQDGSTSATYTLNQAGTYSVAVSREQCTAYDTVRIAQVTPRISIAIPDTTICEGTSIELQVVATPASQFLWNTGSTTDRIVVNKAGTYTVTGTSVCGALSDEVTITQITCNCSNAFVPNAFSPNGDGKNEILQVRLNCPGFTAFRFSIYNRYGQRVFESTDPDRGWDGLQQGNKADVGTYFYLLRYKTNEGKDIQKKGDVILLR